MRGALAQAGARRVLAWALPPSYHAHLFVSIEKPLLPAARCVARGRGAPPLGVDHARQTLAYVADAIYSETNIERIVGLAKGADLFYCEAAFLDRDVLRDATAELYAEARAAFEGALAVLPAVGASGGWRGGVP